MAIAAGTFLGRYEIRAPLGAGGMGEVYLARDTNLDRTVALKILPVTVASDQGRMRRFIREAKAVSALNHPNIIIIHEIGQADSVHFIATEFVEGVTLRQHMTSTRMKLSEVLDVTIQMVGALAAAHAAGIVHRDIKPENIMVRTDGYVKVLDFGLAKLTKSHASDSEAVTMFATEPGRVIGTIAYMSPEQARGLTVDARTDLFSLGIMLYEMIAGRLPFEGATASEMIASILEKEPPLLARYSREVPSDLERIVMKALAKDREERFQTVKDLLIDLRRVKQRLEFEAELERSVPPDLNSKVVVATGGGQSQLSPTKEPAGFSSPNSTAPLPGRGRRSRKAIDSLAVLPLVNASADPNTEYLSEGITESIINSLSQIPKLRVMARSTVFRYKGRETDPQEVGRDLNVRAVLTGRVLQLGDRLIIKAELVNVADGSQLWGEQYNRELSDIFALQEEIAQQISEKLRIKLTGEEKKRLTKRYTENTEAYQFYLKGRFYWNKRTSEAAKKGIEYFEQAIEKDPNYALAYAGLADSYALLGGYDVLRPKDSYPRARAAATKALEIDDTLAEAHTSIARIRMAFDWDWLAAEREFKRAIELNPNYATAHHWYGMYLVRMGRFDEALSEIKQAQKLDPLSLIINADMGAPLFFARQYDQAIEQHRKTLEMDLNFPPTHLRLGAAYEQKGMYQEAIAEYQRAIELSGDNTKTSVVLGYAYAVSGRRAEAQKELDQLKEQSNSPYDIAMIYTALGDKEQAFEWLEKAYEDRSGGLVFLKVDPGLDSLRSDPRFADLLRRVGLTP